jgi:hypothetical protein
VLHQIKAAARCVTHPKYNPFTLALILSKGFKRVGIFLLKYCFLLRMMGFVIVDVEKNLVVAKADGEKGIVIWRFFSGG